ncbi:hypothetical protein GCM10017608_04660 [Agromyces luteolus]|uniref:Uncharacterized protein n=1 Tax=Agromyces luteolus TaxID=88373 RepID=A0A7C9LCV8_9MICO|nr:hypothetical protein [Agromyces luteolus]MUN06431.1 hypothetical protein [Agromyces luteolus]GLK26534.1 hypothetical protein GCM10017608_04660 [Agromyces luteolus]
MTRPSLPTQARARRRTRPALVAASALTVIALAGCAAPAPAEPDTIPDAASETSLVLIPMPDLEPVPDPAPPLTAAESEAARLADADAQWAALLVTYPDAVRPADPFAGYISEADRLDVRRACYDAEGLTIEEGFAATDPDGPAISISAQPQDEAEAIAAWGCDATHPIQRTASGPTDAELGWIYDYLVAYSAPCLEANGIDNPPAAPRDEWVTKWPDYVWFPSTGTAPMDPETEQALFELCLDVDTKMAELRAAQGQG